MKKLSIIVPRYKESESDIVPLLSSIRTQLNVDFEQIEVIIANDSPDDALDLDKFTVFGLDVKQVVLPENMGPGMARQYGIDNAEGEYLMFCDADDSLHSAAVLSTFFVELKKFPDTDYFSSPWIEEIYDSDKKDFSYFTHELDNTWLHGKIIRKDLITENEIKFSPELRVHEDSYFLSIVADFAKNRRHLNIPTYVWRWHGESITRRNDGLYLYEDFPTFIHAISLANADFMKRGSSMLEYHVDQFVIYCYFTFQRNNWMKPEVAVYRDKAIKTLTEEMKPFWEVWDKTSRDYLIRIYNEERDKNFKGEIEIYTLEDFVKLIRS